MIQILLDKLRSDEDTKIVRASLRAIDNILEAAEDAGGVGTDNPYLMKIVECGGVPIIEKLQEHPDGGVYKQVSRLIDRYLMSYST